MKEGWTYKILLDCIYNIPKQKQVKSKDYKTKGLYPIVSQEKDLISGYWDDETYLYRHDKPIIIFGDHTKEIKFIDFDFVVGADGTKILYPKDNLDSKFFYYALIATPLRELGYARHFRLLKEKSFPTPPLSEQQRIVAQLDEAFAEIDMIKAEAEKQLSDAKALFQKALSQAMTPKEGWEKKKLKDICRVINGRAYSKEEMLTKGKYRLLRVGNFFTNDTWYYSDLELDEDKYCDKGDLLFAWSASFGPRIWKGEKVIYHYHIWKMICNNEINKYFMCYWLDSEELKKQTLTNLHGATMTHITKAIIENAFVRYPPLSEQQRIVEELDELSENVKEIEALNNKLTAECDAMKQALLRQVFE